MVENKIIVKNIINGLKYVSIPEVDLYIQCGSPAESVKHLIKRDLIYFKTVDGVTFETGPNTILLSDVMIQNGEFSNMSEFSVLQMLYKQGTIIPNHPNNTGIKPILVGDHSQVNSQMQYIYRGNYGLVSQEEIESCGIDKEYAQELMKMKLKFAFGKLQPATSLLDSRVVKNAKIEIRDGVYIKRDELNKFEISYKDESVKIDLNLYESETYKSPYILPQYKINREYFSVIHSGQGDGWDASRPSMNSIITFQGKLYLIDVVPNIKHILSSLSIDINEIEGVFLTHTHDDHLAGITSLIRSDKKIKFYASHLIISAAIKKLSVLLDVEEHEFYNLLDIEPLGLNQWSNIDGLEVQPILSPHPVETTIFVFRTMFEDGYKTYGHFADIIDTKVLSNMISKDDGKTGISQEFYDNVVSSYTQTLDLKKIDIGGGMIHGHADDFLEDKSTKIVLAHTSNELTKDEKKVGSGSLFGLSDVLIPSNQNYDLVVVKKYLLSNFKQLSTYQINMFLNFKIVHFSPETIVLREDESADSVYLLLSGQVEALDNYSDDNTILTPGTIIGEKISFEKKQSCTTYVAINYVKTLEIPATFFYNFIAKNELTSDMEDKAFNRSVLTKTELFNEEITYSTLNHIIETLDSHRQEKGIVSIDKQRVYIIIEGQVEVKINDSVIETLENGDHFGGVHTVLSYPSMFSFEATKDTILYSVSAEVLKNIPIVRWKILEKYERQKNHLVKFHLENDGDEKFYWNENYRVNVSEMDNHHKRIFEIIYNINICLKSKAYDSLGAIFESLMNYTKYHFEVEEKLMEKYKCSDIDDHILSHRSFVEKLEAFYEDIQNGKLNKMHLTLTLKSWFVKHIIEEDKKYSKLLNAKGVF